MLHLCLLASHRLIKHQVAIPSEFYGSSGISLLHFLLPPFSFIFLSLAYLNFQTICFSASTFFFPLNWIHLVAHLITLSPQAEACYHSFHASSNFPLGLCSALEATSCSSLASFDMALTIDPKSFTHLNLFGQQNSQWAHFFSCPSSTRNKNINCCATWQQSGTPSGGGALNFAHCSSGLVEWWPT